LLLERITLHRLLSLDQQIGRKAVEIRFAGIAAQPGRALEELVNAVSHAVIRLKMSRYAPGNRVLGGSNLGLVESIIGLHRRDCWSAMRRTATWPAIAAKRLSLTPNGNARYQLKTPCRDGTMHVIFEPLELMAPIPVRHPMGDLRSSKSPGWPPPCRALSQRRMRTP
jgi:hypothetical protein